MIHSPDSSAIFDVALDTTRQRRIGLALAAMIIVAWLTLHVGLIFFFPLSWPMALFAVPLLLVQTWLYVGLFIIAHDCMHGSLVPFRPAANRCIGRMCLVVYVGFSFDTLDWDTIDITGIRGRPETRISMTSDRGGLNK